MVIRWGSCVQLAFPTMINFRILLVTVIVSFSLIGNSYSSEFQLNCIGYSDFELIMNNKKIKEPYKTEYKNRYSRFIIFVDGDFKFVRDDQNFSNAKIYCNKDLNEISCKDVVLEKNTCKESKIFYHMNLNKLSGNIDIYKNFECVDENNSIHQINQFNGICTKNTIQPLW